LQDRITLLKEDYRNLNGKYDKLLSIEMLEAVGWHYFDAYFEKCANLLKQDGIMCIQTITMADQDYEASKDSVDFIKKHIFPGGCLPSTTCICASVTKKTDLRLVDFDDITPHYAKTLRMWRENVYKNTEQIRALGFDERFMRMWEYYLAYCEGGFEEQCIGACQLVFKKPDARTGFVRYGETYTALPCSN
jgi:cyclopropane-fatty-acyl-phospholipid synthase